MDFFENQKALFNALQSVNHALLSTCNNADKFHGSREHIVADQFPKITICVSVDTEHYLDSEAITPPQLVLRPESWRREDLHAIVIGKIVGETDVNCGPGEIGIIFAAQVVHVMKDKKKLKSIEIAD